MKRMNDLWEIIGAVKVFEENGHTLEVVIGVRDRCAFGFEWVTWECFDGKEYNYGHYYDREPHAFRDFKERVWTGYMNYHLKEMEREMVCDGYNEDDGNGKEHIMNTFDVYDCSVSFRTNAKTYKEAWDELVSLLESVGVEILDGTEEVLMDEDGNELDEEGNVL